MDEEICTGGYAVYGSAGILQDGFPVMWKKLLLSKKKGTEAKALHFCNIRQQHQAEETQHV